VNAAKDLPIFFDPVTDDSAMAVRTGRRKRMNRALKAVEHMFLSVSHELEGFIIIIPAHFALSHTKKVRACA
jgi:hypothetical protein